MTQPMDSGWAPLSVGSSFRHLAIPASAGPLAHLAPGEMAVGARSGLLVALGLHHIVPATIVSDLRDHLLVKGASATDAVSRVSLVQEEVWRLHETGGFYECVPEIMVACASGDSLAAWCAGSNGCAVVDSSGIRTVGDDLRYAALARRGADLSALHLAGLAPKWPTHEVSGLTQLEPQQTLHQITRIGREQAVVLLSSGALPFGTHEQAAGISEWSRRDCGWRYGMAADVVVVALDARRRLADPVVTAFKESLMGSSEADGNTR